MKLPKNRTSGILEREADSELLIYDLQIDKAYNLNETSKIVYKACSRAATFDELKQRYQFDDDLIYLTLDELKQRNLIEDDYVSPFAGINRREVIRKVGLATMIALPTISSLIAPPAANAVSTVQSDCPARGGTCIRASENLCAGRANQTVTFYYYNTGDGTCQGATFASNPNFPCGNTSPSSQQFDVCRVG